MEQKETQEKIKKDYTPYIKLVFKTVLYFEVGYITNLWNCTSISDPKVWVFIGCIMGIDMLSYNYGKYIGKIQAFKFVKENISLAKKLNEALRIRRELLKVVEKLQKIEGKNGEENK